MSIELTGEGLYTGEQTRALDSSAIHGHGIPGIRLMGRAAQAAYDLLCEAWPETAPLHVFCGTGNNGGDGYLVAWLAARAGRPVTLYPLGDVTKISGDAAIARERALELGVVEQAFTDGGALSDGIIVDAMLGTGLGGDVREPYAGAIDAINAAERPVLAIDIPSGLCSDSGRELGIAVRADITVTFIGLKRGLFTADGPDCCGALHFSDLEVPGVVYDEQPASCQRLDLDALLAQWPARSASAHKGNFGRVLVVGGDDGMAGAAAMAAEAAARTGAGLVSCATRPQHVAAIIARRPEVMAHGLMYAAHIERLLQAAEVVVIGPGLGQSPWSEQLLQRVLATELPLVVDADALNLLPHIATADQSRRDNWLLTPHPGEAARLLGCSTAAVQADRFAAVSALQETFGGAALLKGAGTLIAGDGGLALCDYGNPGMASGGMGDVLSGILGGLMAQGFSPLEAAALGSCLHGAAADIAAADGQRGLLAADLMVPLRELLG